MGVLQEWEIDRSKYLPMVPCKAAASLDSGCICRGVAVNIVAPSCCSPALQVEGVFTGIKDPKSHDAGDDASKESASHVDRRSKRTNKQENNSC